MFYKIISLLQWRRAGQGSPGAAASVLPQGPQEPEVRVPEQQPDCCGQARRATASTRLMQVNPHLPLDEGP